MYQRYEFTVEDSNFHFYLSAATNPCCLTVKLFALVRATTSSHAGLCVRKRKIYHCADIALRERCCKQTPLDGREPRYIISCNFHWLYRYMPYQLTFMPKNQQPEFYYHIRCVALMSNIKFHFRFTRHDEN